MNIIVNIVIVKVSYSALAGRTITSIPHAVNIGGRDCRSEKKQDG